MQHVGMLRAITAMRLTDDGLLVFAFRELSLIAAAELDPASEADRALVGRLVAITDRSDVVAALDRWDRKNGPKPIPKSD